MSSFPPTIDSLLMDQSFINDCLGRDAEATAYWQTFQQVHPEYREVLDEARRCIQAMHGWGQSEEITEQWDALQEMIGRGETGEPLAELAVPLGKRPARLLWISGIAAAGVGALVCTGLFWKKNLKDSPVPYISLTAPAGTVKRCNLPDGSVVWLDAGSAIRYREDGRGVELLEGQIFCKVKHDAEHPFSVHTPAGLDVKDIGTAFSVQSYKGLGREVVKVLEGSVALQKKDSTLDILKERQGAGWNVESEKLSRIDNLAGGDTSWISGRIELNDVTFGELAIVLEKTYDIHITFEHPDLINYRASTSFYRTDPVKDVLDALRLIYGISFTTQGRDIILHGHGHL